MRIVVYYLLMGLPKQHISWISGQRAALEHHSSSWSIFSTLRMSQLILRNWPFLCAFPFLNTLWCSTPHHTPSICPLDSRPFKGKDCILVPHSWGLSLYSAGAGTITAGEIMPISKPLQTLPAFLVTSSPQLQGDFTMHAHGKLQFLS